MPWWNFVIYKWKGAGIWSIWGGTPLKKNLWWRVSSVFICSLCLRVGCVGISKVFIVSKSIRPSSKLLVQAKTKKTKKNKTEMYSRGVTTNGILFLSQKVGVPSLPVVLLFGKNGWWKERAEQSGDTAGICTEGLGNRGMGLGGGDALKRL